MTEKMAEQPYVLKNGGSLDREEDTRLMEKLIELNPMVSIDFRHNDIGLGNLYAACFAYKARFCVDNLQWYLYENGCWKIDKGEIKSQGLMQTLLQMLHMYADEIADDYDADSIKQYHSYINKSSSDAIVRRALNASKNNLVIDITEFDANPYFLNCTNGVFDLRTQAFRQSVAADYLTRSTACGYMPDKLFTPCSRWYSFIDEITSGDKDKAKYLQKALGYSLLGENEQECLFIAYGKTLRNGKGTLFNSVAKVLGLGLENGYGGSISPLLICDTGKERDYNAPEPMLADTLGVRYLTLSEAKRDIELDSASVKSFTGRDPRKTRQLHAHAFTFTPQFTIWLSTNYLPRVNDDGIFRSDRMWVIPFDRHFEREERDETLKRQFETTDAMRTILRWLIDGYKLYVQEGLLPPQSVVDATNDYARKNDRPRCFVEECCETVSGEKTNRKEMFKAYERWCKDDERSYKHILGSGKFYESMRRFFTEYDAGNGDRGFRDVRLKRQPGTITL